MAKIYNKKLEGKYKIANNHFNLSTFQEFVDLFNVYNNELANQENLNKGIDQLKRELNMLYALYAILTDQEAPRWQPNVVYQEGEIVSYLDKENPSETEIQNSYYLALYNDEENLAKEPPFSTKFWVNVTATEIYPRFNSSVWARYHNEKDWTQDQEYDLINLKKLKELILNLNTEILNLLNEDYLTNNYTKELDITEPTHITNKKYVDFHIEKVKKSLQDTNSILGQYVRVDESRKLIAANNGIAAVLTPDAGIHPGLNEQSTLGTPSQKYKAVYAKSFEGTALKARYADLAEYYDFDINAKPGDVIGLNEDGFALYDINELHKLIGVVTTNPAVILNSESKGTCIALKGQTPVKVLGPVRLGMYINAFENGVGIASDFKSDETIGIALESSDDNHIKLINVKI